MWMLLQSVTYVYPPNQSGLLGTEGTTSLWLLASQLHWYLQPSHLYAMLLIQYVHMEVSTFWVDNDDLSEWGRDGPSRETGGWKFASAVTARRDIVVCCGMSCKIAERRPKRASDVFTWSSCWLPLLFHLHGCMLAAHYVAAVILDEDLSMVACWPHIMLLQRFWMKISLN
jgi:hypothetical protein